MNQIWTLVSNYIQRHDTPTYQKLRSVVTTMMIRVRIIRMRMKDNLQPIDEPGPPPKGLLSFDPNL